MVGFSQGQARDRGAVVFVCRYGDSEFNVVQNTTISSRKLQYEFLLSNPAHLEWLKNVPLTIEFAGLSDLGVPQQPRGILFRFDLVQGLHDDHLALLERLF